MSSLMASAAWYMGRLSSVVVLNINNKSQVLIFLQARPTREEKLREMRLLPSRASQFSEKETPGG